jgi:transposase
MLADQVDAVIGVDTHRDSHSLAVVNAATGAVVAETTIETNARGDAGALTFAGRNAPGRRAWAIEGSGGDGAGLTRLLACRGERVVEIDRPERRAERTQAKSDALDAVRAAHTALSRRRLASPRTGELREALRVLMIARAGAMQTRARSIRQLKALIVTAPEQLRARLRCLTGLGLLRHCAALRVGGRADAALLATTSALRSLARQALAGTGAVTRLEREIEQIARGLVPDLLAEVGVGPICAAQSVISYSHPGRFHRESAFARLAGSAPIPASSGQVVRHRLDRGGDRQLNRALHTIVLCRRTCDPATKAYIERRVREGKSLREAVRCLKRYVARRIFRILEASLTT